MKPACLPLLVLSAVLAGCGSDSGQPRTPDPPAGRFIHSPPLSRLNPEQLRALSMDCEKYSPDGSSRGPYDIAYCENAIAAWGDNSSRGEVQDERGAGGVVGDVDRSRRVG